jgi:hypothetical protein
VKVTWEQLRPEVRFGASHTVPETKHGAKRRPRCCERCTIEARNLRVAEERDESERECTKRFLFVLVALVESSGCSSSNSGPTGPGPNVVFPDGSVAPTAACESEGGGDPVAKPVRVRTLTGDKSWAETGWFSSPGLVDLNGDGKKEIVAPFHSLFVFVSAGGAPKTFASESVLVDLNRDGVPEIVFGTYSLQTNGGRLVVLDNTGEELYDITLDNQGMGGGNGIGVPAAPSVADIDGDGNLEIVLLTFDHGVDVYTVPGSGGKCLPWPTGRGNLLRNGQGPAYVR